MSTSITISTDMEDRLARIAEQTGEPADQHLENALAEYLSEQEAALVASRRAAKSGPKVSFDALEKELGLDS